MASLWSCRAVPPSLGPLSARRYQQASRGAATAAAAAAAHAPQTRHGAAPRTWPAAHAPRRSLHGTAAPRKQKLPEDTASMQKIILRAAEKRKGSNMVGAYDTYVHVQDTHKFFSARAAYTISPEARKKDTIRRTEDGEEIGVGGGPWHQDLGLLPTFSTWAQVTMLHMYLAIVRFRCLDKEQYQNVQKQLVDAFFYEAEERMDVQHGLSSRSLRQHHLKDLFLAWRGLVLAYDEGMVRGDAVLAAAVWRNLFKARPEPELDLRRLAAVVAWMRATVFRLDHVPDSDVVARATSAFEASPAAELLFVDVPAKELVGVLPGGAAAKPGAKSPAARAAGTA
ncbi:hypothetical protein RB594_002912 [Gaeumannomyces avenae]